MFCQDFSYLRGGYLNHRIEMNKLIEVFYILFFYFVGEAVSQLIDGFIPGSVIGMVLLFLALSFRCVKPQQVGRVSTLLTQNMGLFFVPAGVGLMNAIGIISQYWAVLLIASLVSTILVIASVAYTQESFEKKRHHE